jgi:hypothetical protein
MVDNGIARGFDDSCLEAAEHNMPSCMRPFSVDFVSMLIFRELTDQFPNGACFERLDATVTPDSYDPNIIRSTSGGTCAAAHRTTDGFEWVGRTL